MCYNFFSNSDFDNFFNKRIATDYTEDFAEVHEVINKDVLEMKRE